jgi:hypothetical protein
VSATLPTPEAAPEEDAEDANIIKIAGSDKDGWSCVSGERHDPLLRMWDTAADARAELGPALTWWEEEPGFWLAEAAPKAPNAFQRGMDALTALLSDDLAGVTMDEAIGDLGRAPEVQGGDCDDGSGFCGPRDRDEEDDGNCDGCGTRYLFDEPDPGSSGPWWNANTPDGDTTGPGDTAPTRAEAGPRDATIAGLEQRVCDFQAAAMIDVGNQGGPCRVEPHHVEKHVTGLYAEIADPNDGEAVIGEVARAALACVA